MQPLQSAVDDTYNLDSHVGLQQALSLRPDLTIVCTPTALHREPVLAAIAARSPVLVEKPATSSAVDAEAIARESVKNGVPVIVGYQRRQHPAWLRTLGILHSATTPQAEELRFTCHSNVADWHSYEPVQHLYAVRQDLGGGVLLTECHELDLVIGEFGTPTSVSCSESSPSDQFDVEMRVVLELKFGHLAVNFDLSLASDTPQRGWLMRAEGVTVEWDELTGEFIETDPTSRSGEVTRISGYSNEELAIVQAKRLARDGIPQTNLKREMLVHQVISEARRSLRAGGAMIEFNARGERR